MSFWQDLLDQLLGKTKPPKPVPPAPPPTPPAALHKYIRLTVPGLPPSVRPTATLRLDAGEVFDGTTDGPSITFTMPGDVQPWGATVRVSAAGFATREQRLVISAPPTAAPIATAPTQYLGALTLKPSTPTPPAPEPDVHPPPGPVKPPKPSGDAIVLSLASIASDDCPDVRSWPIGRRLESFEFADGELFERGDTMVTFEGRDTLTPAMGSQGAIAYTLWMGCFLQGLWRILPIVECIGSYVPTGHLLAPGQINNVTYYAKAPLKGHQPAPGEPVIFFCTSGDTRRQNAQPPATATLVAAIGPPWRTNVVQVPFRVGIWTY